MSFPREDDRSPTADESAGMTWWNAMPDGERARWAKRAATGVAADAWALYKSTQYRIDHPGLKAAIDAALPSAKHTALLKAICAVDGFAAAKLARVETGITSLVRRKVVNAAGEILHDDHAKWIAAELAADAGSVSTTRVRLAALGYWLSKCAIDTLRIVVDHGSEQSNFVQITVNRLHEAVDRRLFDPAGGWSTPRNLNDLIEDCVQGQCVAEADRRPVGAEQYELKEAVDLASFVRAAQMVHAERLAVQRRMKLAVTDFEGRVEVMTGAQIDPNAGRYACREQRFFDDWTEASAGRSGARACEHWTYQLSDWTDPKDGERYLNFVPEWTVTRKVAKLESRPASDYALFGKLEMLDARVGVPFGWYFFMIHGNRVRDWAGEMVLTAAEAGRIVLPEHDYQVLRRWRARSYGF